MITVPTLIITNHRLVKHAGNYLSELEWQT